MNREIKFRAWFKVQNRMVYNLGFDQFSFKTLEELEGTEYIPSVYDMDVVVDDENFDLSYEGTFNFEIMQYTGLKDKNSIEIYEGDIVKAKDYKPSLYQIKFIEGGYCLTNPKLEGYPLDINVLYPSMGCQIEVIGNIYENPELIKEED